MLDLIAWGLATTMVYGGIVGFVLTWAWTFYRMFKERKVR